VILERDSVVTPTAVTVAAAVTVAVVEPRETDGETRNCAGREQKDGDSSSHGSFLSFSCFGGWFSTDS
jgi:hypothetical protein